MNRPALISSKQSKVGGHPAVGEGASPVDSRFRGNDDKWFPSFPRKRESTKNKRSGGGPSKRRRDANGPRPGVYARAATLRLMLLLALVSAGVGPAAAEDLLRVTCRGLFQLSVTEPALECSESDVLTDPEGGLLSAFSAAEADLARARLGAGAAGGAIRDVGYIGREASALLLQEFRIEGDWQGVMPLTITLELRYGFGGYGEGRMRAALWSSLDGSVRRENYAGLRMRHTGFGGALLSDDNSRGNHSLPQPGPYPSRSDLRVRVVQHVARERPDIVVRADLYMLATPSLGSLDTTTSALATAPGGARDVCAVSGERILAVRRPFGSSVGAERRGSSRRHGVALRSRGQ